MSSACIHNTRRHRTSSRSPAGEDSPWGELLWGRGSPPDSHTHSGSLSGWGWRGEGGGGKRWRHDIALSVTNFPVPAKNTDFHRSLISARRAETEQYTVRQRASKNSAAASCKMGRIWEGFWLSKGFDAGKCLTGVTSGGKNNGIWRKRVCE